MCSLLLFVGCSESPAWNGTDVSGVFPDLEFSLLNSDGETVDADSFRGRTTLLYFGFTNCPGACPATLGQISVTLTELGKLLKMCRSCSCQLIRNVTRHRR